VTGAFPTAAAAGEEREGRRCSDNGTGGNDRSQEAAAVGCFRQSLGVRPQGICGHWVCSYRLDMVNIDMPNMHIFSLLSILSEGTMPSNIAIVSPELSNRIVVLLSDEMLKRLDEWRWENRISSRGEAVRQLVKRGLEREPPKAEKPGK
jgi:hypothetical protein